MPYGKDGIHCDVYVTTSLKFILYNVFIISDIDECLDAGINCIGGECCNTHGSFKCFCPTGYTLNGTVCEGIIIGL